MNSTLDLRTLHEQLCELHNHLKLARTSEAKRGTVEYRERTADLDEVRSVLSLVEMIMQDEQARQQ